MKRLLVAHNAEFYVPIVWLSFGFVWTVEEIIFYIIVTRIPIRFSSETKNGNESRNSGSQGKYLECISKLKEKNWKINIDEPREL